MKKYIGFMLTWVLILQIMIMPVNAATEEEVYAGNQLRILGVLKGYSDGSLKLDNPITRAEVATLTVRILGYEDTTILGTDKVFIDVASGEWYYKYIQNAYKLGVINGYPDSSFKPAKDITYAEVVAIMVNALGRNENLEGAWPDNYMNRGKELGIIPQETTIAPGAKATRGQMAVVVWDTLLVEQ